MKRVFFFVVILTLLLTPTMLCAEGEAERAENALSIDPVSFIFNFYKVSYERLMADQFSAGVELGWSPDFFWGLHGYSELTYLDVVVKGRYYFGSLFKSAVQDVDIKRIEKHLTRIFTDALGGLYIGAFGGYVNSIVADGENANYFKGSFNGYGGGLEVGCKYRFGKKPLSFYIEPFMLARLYTGSYGYKDSSGNTILKPTDFEDGLNRNGISAGINFGLTF